MRTLIVGSGPTGLILGAALARRGHQVTSVDRDPGPTTGAWVRRGVMQFEHAHGFRPQVAETLQAQWPQALTRWQELGAQLVDAPGPAGDPQLLGVLSRRSTFERALRAAAAEQPGLTLRTGHVDGLELERGRVIGARVDGRRVEADLVVDASGRTGRLSSSTAPGPPRGRRRLRPGVRRPHLPAAPRSAAGPDGEPDRLRCRLRRLPVPGLPARGRPLLGGIIRPTADAALKALRFQAAFEAACRAIPALAEWIDPARAHPTSAVLVGGALRNVYRRQPGTPGLVASVTAWRPRPRPVGVGSPWPACRSSPCSPLRRRGRPGHRGWTVRRLVRRQHRTLGGRPRRHRRRHGQALERRRPRPQHPAYLRPHRRRSRSRPPHQPSRRRLLRDDRVARHTGAGRATGAGRLPKRLAAGVRTRPHARPLVDVINAAVPPPDPIAGVRHSAANRQPG